MNIDRLKKLRDEIRAMPPANLKSDLWTMFTRHTAISLLVYHIKQEQNPSETIIAFVDNWKKWTRIIYEKDPENNKEYLDLIDKVGDEIKNGLLEEL